MLPASQGTILQNLVKGKKFYPLQLPMEMGSVIKNFKRGRRGRDQPDQPRHFLKEGFSRSPKGKNMSTHRSYKGIALIWVALLGIVFVGFVGLAIDTSYCLWAAHRLQIAADAAALAGAQRVVVDVDAAHDAAIRIAGENTAGGESVILAPNWDNDPAGDVVIGRFNSDDGTFTPGLASPNAVKVNARRTDDSPGGPLALVFGPVFGIRTINVSRSAIAIAGGGLGAGLIVLSEHAHQALDLRGNSNLEVRDGAIQVNSDQDDALRVGGDVTVDAAGINVVGGVDATAETQAKVNTDADVVPDPLASLPPVPIPSGVPPRTIKTAGTYQPGYYSGGIDAGNPKGTITLEPGIYILDGAGLSLGSKAVLAANGVMLYITGSGSVDIQAGSIVTLTPPDPALYSYPGVDTYKGIAIFQDRNDTHAGTLNGHPGIIVQGTIYMPKADVSFVGTSDTIGNQMIVNTLKIVGGASLTIIYGGRNPLPSMKSWLVQ